MVRGGSQREARLALIGYGGVGRAFHREVTRRREDIASRYGVDLRIVLIQRAGRQAQGETLEPGAQEWTAAAPISGSLSGLGVEVVVQAVPSDPSTLGAARQQTIDSLAAGAHVVTATKGHLVQSWTELDAAARRFRRAIRISAACGAALPAADLARRGLRGLECDSVEASLNGTSNFVLEAVARGSTVAEATSIAAELGICEPDPVADLSGRDSAMKLVLLSNLVWGSEHRLEDVDVEPIDDTTTQRAIELGHEGSVLRPVAVAHRDKRQRMRVALVELEASHPLARLKGAEKAVCFNSPRAGSIVVSGGASSPVGAALALLKDVLNLLTGDGAPGLF